MGSSLRLKLCHDGLQHNTGHSLRGTRLCTPPRGSVKKKWVRTNVRQDKGATQTLRE